MESRENFEDLALKKSILPVIIYLLICFAVFFAIDQASIGANKFLGQDNLKLVNILKGAFIGLLTTFLIFFLVYKYKFVEINALRNMNSIVNASLYPELIVQDKNHTVVSCSPVFSKLLGYSLKDMKGLTLNDILTEASYKAIQEQNANKDYVNHDFSDLHFIDKNQQLMRLSANVMKYELLEKHYLIIRCNNAKVSGNAPVETSPETKTARRSFQF